MPSPVWLAPLPVAPVHVRQCKSDSAELDSMTPRRASRARPRSMRLSSTAGQSRDQYYSIAFP